MEKQQKRNYTKQPKQSLDLNQLKPTPKSRPPHEAFFDGALVNPKPDRKYVLAPTDEGHPMNYAYYSAIGYAVELAEPGGVRIRLGTTPVIGEPLAWRGNILLSCSLERSDEIFRFGPTGNTGQAYYDKVMAKIKNNQLEDRVPVRGLSEKVDISDLVQVGIPEVRE